MNDVHKKRTGRPRKHPDQLKKLVVKVRVSPGEHDRVKSMAARRGVTMSDMIRDCLFKDGEHANSTR